MTINWGTVGAIALFGGSVLGFGVDALLGLLHYSWAVTGMLALFWLRLETLIQALKDQGIVEPQTDRLFYEE